MNSDYTEPPQKRPRLDSTDASLWTFSSKNKPIGIALPLMVETRESDTPKLEEPMDIKPSCIYREGKKAMEKMKFLSVTLDSSDDQDVDMKRSFPDYHSGRDAGADMGGTLKLHVDAPSRAHRGDNKEAAVDSMTEEMRYGSLPEKHKEGGGDRSSAAHEGNATTAMMSGRRPNGMHCYHKNPE